MAKVQAMAHKKQQKQIISLARLWHIALIIWVLALISMAYLVHIEFAPTIGL